MSKDLQIEDIEFGSKEFQPANITQSTQQPTKSSTLSSDCDDLDKLISVIDTSIQQNYGHVVMSDFGEEVVD